jgi:hypothetical protein
LLCKEGRNPRKGMRYFANDLDSLLPFTHIFVREIALHSFYLRANHYAMQDLKITLIQSDLHWEDAEANLSMFERKSGELMVAPM